MRLYSTLQLVSFQSLMVRLNSMFSRNLDALPSLLTTLIHPAMRNCGAVALVTVVAPIPRKNGQIDVQMSVSL